MAKETVINVNDIDIFVRYLKGLSVFTDNAEFNIGKNGCSIYSLNASVTNRLIYWTDAVTCEQDISFALESNVQKFLKCLRTTSSYVPDVDLAYDGTYVKTKKGGKSSFRLQTTDRDVIANHISNPIKSEYENLFGVYVNNDKFKEIKRLSFIDNANESKLYIYRKDDAIIADIDDKSQELSESISIPLQDEESNIINKDKWEGVVPVFFESFGQYNLVDSDWIELNYIDKGALNVVAQYPSEDEPRIVQQMISSVLPADE